MIWLRWIAGTLVCGWLGQFLLALLVPHLVMERLHSGVAEAVGFNSLLVNAKPDETSRGVVRPSRDLLYGICAYNPKEGPVSVTAPVPHRYRSMQFYQMNTDNFASITNQRDQRFRVGAVVEATIIGPDAAPDDYPGMVIQSPTLRGVMLLRASGIGDDSESRAALDSSSCTSAAKAEAAH